MLRWRAFDRTLKAERLYWENYSTHEDAKHSNTPLVFSPKMLVNWESISELHESRYANGHSSPDVIKLQDTELRVEGSRILGLSQKCIKQFVIFIFSLSLTQRERIMVVKRR